MVKYLFKLKNSYVPDLTHANEKDKLYAGVRLTYTISIVYFFRLKKLSKDIVYWHRRLGTKTFLRSYKKYWDKEKYYLPHVYWGKTKHPLVRLWVILNDKRSTLGDLKIIPEATLQYRFVKIFNRRFISKDIAVHLFKRHSKFSINK